MKCEKWWIVRNCTRKYIFDDEFRFEENVKNCGKIIKDQRINEDFDKNWKNYHWSEKKPLKKMFIHGG